MKWIARWLENTIWCQSLVGRSVELDFSDATIDSPLLTKTRLREDSVEPNCIRQNRFAGIEQFNPW